MTDVREQEVKTSFEVPVNFTPMKGFGGGFRMPWISGENEDIQLGLDSGGGVGNPLMTFWFEDKTGKCKDRQYFTVDMRDVLQSLGEQVEEHLHAK